MNKPENTPKTAKVDLVDGFIAERTPEGFVFTMPDGQQTEPVSQEEIGSTLSKIT